MSEAKYGEESTSGIYLLLPPIPITYGSAEAAAAVEAEAVAWDTATLAALARSGGASNGSLSAADVEVELDVWDDMSSNGLAVVGGASTGGMALKMSPPPSLCGCEEKGGVAPD